MSLMQSPQRVHAAEHIAVRCVDADVHPYPKRGQLVEHIPEPLRSKYFLARRVGETISTMRPITRMPVRCAPIPSTRRRIRRQRPGHGIPATDYRGGRGHRNPGTPRGVNLPSRSTHAFALALNNWQANHWLDGRNNWHERWRGSIAVAIEDPARLLADRALGRPPIHGTDSDQCGAPAIVGRPEV